MFSALTYAQADAPVLAKTADDLRKQRDAEVARIDADAKAKEQAIVRATPDGLAELASARARKPPGEGKP